MIKHALTALVLTACSTYVPARAVSIPVVTSVAAAPRFAASTPQNASRTATLRDSTWRVIEASDGGTEIASNSESCPNEKQRTDGRFVFVHFEVTNRTTQEQIVLARPEIEDARGRSFGPVDMEVCYVPANGKTSGLTALRPGVPTKAWTVIELPADATELRLVVHDFLVFGSTQEIPLPDAAW